MKVYVVEMLRFGEREGHSYVAGVFESLEEAKLCGANEVSRRDGKYEPHIRLFTVGQADKGEWMQRGWAMQGMIPGYPNMQRDTESFA